MIETFSSRNTKTKSKAQRKKINKERNVAKKNKDYSKADNIREELESRGILISDTREGTSYQLK